MGRPRKEEVVVVQPESELDELLNQFEDGVEICGRVYRITTPIDSIGKPSREAVGKVNEIVDEDYIGRTFGSGTYLVKYSLKDSSRTEYKSVTMHIGKEYDKFREPKPAAPSAPTAATVGGLDLGGILGTLTVEKLAVISGVIKTVKDIFAPHQPQFDITKMFELMMSNNKPNVSDAVLVKCLDGMQRQNAAPSITQQITEFKALKDAFRDEFDNDNDEEKGDTMNFLLEKGFELLPALLHNKNNDYQAVGREVRENPIVKSIINSDPELTKKFFEKAVKDYGVEAANQLAAGFGYQVTQKQPEVVENGENIG